ncbi:mannitol dehydrogenase family protein [Phenylobacterium montanum]|uniref:Mannitol dehydrogenase family protein n=1 Tax=Phenylobacterium montanum TaxID=2823693 RepID=A0A975IVF0_9CAUL|nr:mannitol dehydrogenase family protein [Caulobacter sp. S6]QUD88937.1 mannitol dehydrogenase family protein [Caulobacter sp. S6]
MRARLSENTLSSLPAGVERPAYDRKATSIGIVHIGPGAFHRAHQAAYFDALLHRDPRWGICAVSPNNPGVRDALTPQDGLYTLVTLDKEVGFRVIGAIGEILVAPETPAQVFARLAASETALVTLTVTEKGYRLAADGSLDFRHPDIERDRATPAVPASAVGWLVEGLRRRRAQGCAPLSVLSCDNLPGNGHKLGAAVLALARAQGDAALADWIAEAVAFPSSMVDSITPATDDALCNLVAGKLGLDDAWPVQREHFTQWVVEDRLKPGAPDLAACGVQLTKDVGPFEQAKLRLLNAAHSSLAYIGALMGFETVAEAMAEPGLARFIERLLREDVAPSLKPSADLDLSAYITAILDRFRNPAIRHRLSQIAVDGSQKLPVRLFATIERALADGRPIGRLCIPIAAWIAFVVQETRAGGALVDPLADTLAVLARAPGDADAVVGGFLASGSAFPSRIAASPIFRAATASALAGLSAGELRALLERS